MPARRAADRSAPPAGPSARRCPPQWTCPARSAQPAGSAAHRRTPDPGSKDSALRLACPAPESVKVVRTCSATRSSIRTTWPVRSDARHGPSSRPYCSSSTWEASPSELATVSGLPLGCTVIPHDRPLPVCGPPAPPPHAGTINALGAQQQRLQLGNTHSSVGRVGHGPRPIPKTCPVQVLVTHTPGRPATASRIDMPRRQHLQYPPADAVQAHGTADRAARAKRSQPLAPAHRRRVKS